jgi:acyl-CoA synthetase (AMP-forming)/AMP-acid ligase II
MEAKIVDLASGAELPPKQWGEIVVRGPNVMRGYLERPEETRAMIDPEGWMHTGDIGYVDDDGFLFIVDRLKELIKYKGLQVAPAHLEGVLLTHPSIADAAVIGVPDEDAGEVPKAFVVLKSRATPEEIIAFVAARVAPFEKVRSVEVVDAIPRSPSGKVLRRTLKEQELARAAAPTRPAALPGDPPAAAP